ncbi:MAG: alkaline phosphatase [Terriglobales bacterium]
MKVRAITLLPVLIASLVSGQVSRPSHKPSEKVRSVILMIGDGMGNSEITIARNYQYGAAGRLEMDALPFTGTATTYSLDENDPAKINYVTDSAAGGTAWATGSKTSNGRISTQAVTNKPLTTILEVAQKLGLRTGNITTAEITDATPAVLASHVSSRSCQGPADMKSCASETKSQGGLGSIAEQLIDHHVDVLMGGGRQRFEPKIEGGKYDGKTVLQAAEEEGYRVVETAEGLSSLTPGSRVLGLFNADNMSLEWKGDPAISFPGSGPQRCQEAQRPPNEPGLPEMTNSALKLLSSGKSRSGFFLQVEGAQIDKADHAAHPCEQIGETIAFDNAIKVALDYAHVHPDTLVIVTADHGHTSQIVPAVKGTETDHPAGLMSTLTTADKSPMTIAYSTNIACCSKGHSMEHTGVQVRVAAFGPHSDEVSGTHDMTDVYHLIARAIGAEKLTSTLHQGVASTPQGKY